MHYYQFNIGDYLSHTRHLTPIEDICYRRALDYYYLHEKPLTYDVEKLSRLLMLNEYQIELMTILAEFFVTVTDGYINPRADKEIQQYQSFSDAGKRGAAKRWSQGGDRGANGGAIDTPIANNNHKPITTNHKPKEKQSREISLVVTDNFDVFWGQYPQKVGKEAARKAWSKSNPNINQVLNALSWQIESNQWRKGYIPNPATYINQGRWQDEQAKEVLF
jgi:uncharacterized protein YdaU (DUF1376 family)